MNEKLPKQEPKPKYPTEVDLEKQRRDDDYLRAKRKEEEVAAQRDRDQIREKWESKGRCGDCGSLDHVTDMHGFTEKGFTEKKVNENPESE